jgi:serum/glucocorticoid-regulated kinase 2
MKWLRNVDWEAIKNKTIKAPITIDLYESNIHDEFLDVDVTDLNQRNQQGLLESTEDLF